MVNLHIRKLFFTLTVIAAVLFAALSLNPSNAQQVASNILDDVLIENNDYNAVITIKFKRPVRYISHSPAQTSKTITIHIDIIGGFPVSSSGRLENESITLDSDTGLDEVVFETGNRNNNSLLLYFHKKVSYEIIKGSDQRSLSIVVYGVQ